MLKAANDSLFLDFSFPDELIADSPQYPPRVLFSSQESNFEMSFDELRDQFHPGDLLVVNNTKVLRRRVFHENREVLFIKEVAPHIWEVLFQTRGMKIGEEFALPSGVRARLLNRSRPQQIEVFGELNEAYFHEFGELPLPPYIQKVRPTRRAQSEDKAWYQTAFAKKLGSLAAPTAGLHFQESDLVALRTKGVEVQEITLHVGLGTFLPLQGDLCSHVMHFEHVEIPQEVAQAVKKAKYQGGKVWALGTTVTRALESFKAGKLMEQEGAFVGETDLFIKPGFQFQIVDRLLTNFHQPQSTLLALVMAFSGVNRVQSAYAWAIKNRYRLFSYGDLSAWTPIRNCPPS